MSIKELWVNKYAPKNVDEYVFRDEKQKRQIKQWISDGVLPNILLSGSPGVGKTSVAKMLLLELNINPYDILEVNASKDNGVDFIRDKITSFSETMGYGNMRYVLLDESDFLSSAAQSILRHSTEKYSNNVRFILTANYPHKIIPAIHSRCSAGRMHIDKLDINEYTLRLANILIAENVQFQMETLDAIVELSYPDMRVGISQIQANTFDNVLEMPEVNNVSKTTDSITDAIVLFKAGKFKEARTLICQKLSYEEYDDIYRFMYQNLDIWADTEDKEDRCILVIRDGIVKDQAVADREICLSATLVELELIAKNKL